MSYRRIEINLLPPELQPGPAVRSALIINIALILVTMFTILLSAALSIYQLAQYKEDIDHRERSIKSLQSVKDGYQQLQRIDAAVGNYGKIIGIASTNYIDLPVLLSHLSGILPDRVYLTDISNVRAGNVNAVSVLDAKRPTFVTMTFRTANKDLGQIQNTLNRLKTDPVFANCVLTNASLDSQELSNLSELLGIAGTFELPTTFDGNQNHEYYEFIIRAEVQRPLPIEGSRVLNDQLALFKDTNPLPDMAPGQGGSAAQGGSTSQGGASPTGTPEEHGVVGGPEGVTGSDNRGGN
ncbi:hypothetical protein KDL29_16180 [bacterium]|nr:hypothetical protein [bacterium]UNM08583.1 MAG: hypothetical protein H7A35_00705 [Planctomycetales bacterium]